MPPAPPTPLSPPAPSRLFRSGVIFALLTALSFGGLTTLANLYYQDGGNVMTMLLFRFGFATLALLVLARGHLRPPTPARRFGGVLTVGVAWSLGVTCYLGAVHYIEVGIAALILYTFPVIVLILSLAARELRSTVALWAVFLTAFGGLGIMLLPSISRFDPIGLLLAFGAAMLFATTFFLGARLSRAVPARSMALWVTVVGLGITAPVVYLSDALALPRSDQRLAMAGGRNRLVPGRDTLPVQRPGAGAGGADEHGDEPRTDRLGGARRLDSRRTPDPRCNGSAPVRSSAQCCCRNG